VSFVRIVSTGRAKIIAAISRQTRVEITAGRIAPLSGNRIRWEVSIMPTRREILKRLSRLFFWMAAATQLGLNKGSVLFAQIKKRILPENTDPAGLKKENPAYLDTRHLKIMPMDAFGTMGDTNGPFNPETWRLEVTGAVRNPFQLSYPAVLKLPFIERNILLVCPGVFSNHGRWKGVSINEILNRVDPKIISKVVFYGYSNVGDRKETFTIKDARDNLVFLAHHVNGRPLPPKHGHPLRVVAEGHWGFTWVKYVYKVEFA